MTPAMTGREHWDHVYAQRDPMEVSWFQAEPAVSLRLINSTGLPKSAPLIKQPRDEPSDRRRR
jgi:hypothetical protein